MIVKEKIFDKYYIGWPTIRMSDFPPDLLPTDIIDIDYVDAYYSENESWDQHTHFRIFREREETEAEKETRLRELQKNKERLRKQRYERYLELKKEFENADSI